MNRRKTAINIDLKVTLSQLKHINTAYIMHISTTAIKKTHETKHHVIIYIVSCLPRSLTPKIDSGPFKNKASEHFWAITMIFIA